MDKDHEISNAFSPIFSQPHDSNSFPIKRPLLAHYTSIAILEQILKTDEIWFSNPLFMNDFEELRFGIQQGIQAFWGSEAIKTACRSQERFGRLAYAFNFYSDFFQSELLIDTYVFCLSEHEANNNDGLLSMWRGYGGNGSGVAIIFDSRQANVVPESPLLIMPVIYSSTDDRIEWLKNILVRFAEIMASFEIPDDKLHIPAWILFDRIRQFSLFTKHCGFSEEKEWRIAYIKDRDVNHAFAPMCDYTVCNRGVEPKLKFQVEHIPGLTDSDLNLCKIIYKIILGPSTSSPLAKNTVLRMLDKVGKPELKDRVFGSTIPFRATTHDLA